MKHDTKHMDTTRSDTFAGSTPHAWDANETTYWRGQFEREPYFQKDMAWDDYEPAYRFGYDWHERHRGRKFADMESDMSSKWDSMKMKSRLKWEHAKHAVHAAWERMEHAVKDKMHKDDKAHH